MKNILILDNDIQLGEAIKAFLESDYNITVYSDVNLLEALLDILNRHKNNNCYDLAIFDCLMKVNGVIIADFLQILEKSGVTKNKMPIVFFTAYDGLFPGLNHYTRWYKPEDSKNLLKLVKDFLKE